MKEIFNLKESVHCLFAQCQERLVGLTHYVFHRNTISVEDNCYLQDLFADPLLLGKGIARNLIAAFYEQAAQAGTIGVYWHTRSSNQQAMRLYDRVATNTEFVVHRKSLSTTTA